MFSLLSCELVLVAVAEQLRTKHVFANSKQLPFGSEAQSRCAFLAFESHLNILTNLILYLEKVLAHLILAVIEEN